MLKASETPPPLPHGVETVADLHEQWWVAHTKSRFEKAFAWDLLHRGIGYFLPLVERVKVSGGRKRHVLAPLFPGYVFFCGSEEDRHEALATNRLCQVLGIPDQETIADELLAIDKVLAEKGELDPYPFAAVGRRCRITAGPFRGVEGIVVRRSRATHLVLRVSMLGQSVSLETEPDLLEPAE